jgi:hypothetical protein
VSNAFVGNGGGQYLVVFRSGVRVRLDADEITSTSPNMLLFSQGKNVIGSVDVNEVAGMFNMRAIEDYGSGPQEPPKQ